MEEKDWLLQQIRLVKYGIVFLIGSSQFLIALAYLQCQYRIPIG